MTTAMPRAMAQGNRFMECLNTLEDLLYTRSSMESLFDLKNL